MYYVPGVLGLIVIMLAVLLLLGLIGLSSQLVGAMFIMAALSGAAAYLRA